MSYEPKIHFAVVRALLSFTSRIPRRVSITYLIYSNIKNIKPKKGREKESLLRLACLDVLDSKVLNAILVSLNLCYVASGYLGNSVFWSFEAL
jgi:hypothetical protein